MGNEHTNINTESDYFAKTPVEAFSFFILNTQDRVIRQLEHYENFKLRDADVYPAEFIASVRALWSYLRAIYAKKRPQEYKDVLKMVYSTVPDDAVKAFEAMQIFIYEIGITKIDTIRLPKDSTDPLSVDSVLRGLF